MMEHKIVKTQLVIKRSTSWLFYKCDQGFEVGTTENIKPN